MISLAHKETPGSLASDPGGLGVARTCLLSRAYILSYSPRVNGSPTVVRSRCGLLCEGVQRA